MNKSLRLLFLIGWNDCRIFLKNKASYIWLFAVPFLFIYFMGFANRGPGSPSNPIPSVIVENKDTNFLSKVFLEELGTQGLNIVDPAQGEKADRGIRIPADFTQKVFAGKQVKVEFFKNENSAPGMEAMVEVRLVRALIAINSHLLAAASKSLLFPPDEEGVQEARKVPPTVRLESRFAGRKPMPSGFGFSLPGVMVMYIMMNLLIFGGATLSMERQTGVIRRLAVHSIAPGVLVAGKIFGLVLLGVVQFVVFLAAGQFLFGVKLGASLPGVVFILTIYSWVSASLGVLVGSVVKSKDKVVGLCVMVSLMMAAIGGCWWPLELAPASLQFAAHCLPTGWAMTGLHQLISFGGGLPDAGRAILVLSLFGLAANYLAARFFRFE
jgi:ABC-type multidrug transport system permease subunit